MSAPKGPICLEFESLRRGQMMPRANGTKLFDRPVALTSLRRVLDLLTRTPYRSLDWMIRNGYKFSYYRMSVNAKLMNSSGQMLALGSHDELVSFLNMHIRPLAQKREALQEVWTTMEHHKFCYRPENVRKYLGEDIPADRFTGASPDYSHTPEHLFDGDPLAGEIDLPLSGSREADEAAAVQRMVEMGLREPSARDLKDEFVLHHAWPYLRGDGELWFVGQMVRKDFHEKVTIASLKGLREPPRDLPTPERDFWRTAIGDIREWPHDREGLDFEQISRQLFGHVGAVFGYTQFYPGIRYK